jgi:hypothetical protein
LGIGVGSNLAADVLIQPFDDAPAGFLSFLEAGERNAVLTSLWSRIEKDRDLTSSVSSRYGTPREIVRPTAEQSITWAASQAEGPVQALAMFQMPHIDEEIPLLVDFRNRTATVNFVGTLADLPSAFLGETPEPPSESLILPALAALIWHRRRRSNPPA